MMHSFKKFFVSLLAVALGSIMIFATACTAPVTDVPSTQPELKSISVSYTGGAVDYDATIEDLTGITVTAKYDEGDDVTLTKSEYTLFGTLVPDTQSQVLVIYKDKTAQFTVSVNAAPQPTEPEQPTLPELQSITVSYTGGAVDYDATIEDLTGITVTAKYDKGDDIILTDDEYTLFGTLVPDTQSQVLVIYKDKTEQFTVTVNAAPQPEQPTPPEPDTFDYIAAINGNHFNTLAAAVEYANAHPYCEIEIVGEVEGGIYELNESVALIGHENAPVLNDTQFKIKSDKTILFSNLQFSGDSNITTLQGANNGIGVLSIDNCYADVQTYQSGKGEFIHLLEGYGFQSDLYLTNSTIICSGNSDDATQAIWGDGNIRNAVIKGNTFGTPEKRMSRYVVKFMRIMVGGTIEISHNVIYGTTTDSKCFAILDVYDRTTPADVARITLAYNEMDINIVNEQPVYLGLFEQGKIEEVNTKCNKLNNEEFSLISVYDNCTLITTNNYDQAV